MQKETSAQTTSPLLYIFRSIPTSKYNSGNDDEVSNTFISVSLFEKLEI